jgi:hypothetical protein
MILISSCAGKSGGRMTPELSPVFRKSPFFKSLGKIPEHPGFYSLKDDF